MYIIGGNALNNVLMSLYLEREAKKTCFCWTSLETAQATDEHEPKLILIDADETEFRSASSCIEQIDPNNCLGSTPTVVFNGPSDSDIEYRTFQSGYQGYISYETTPELLLRAIKSIEQGEIWFSRETLMRGIQQPIRRPEATSLLIALTAREIDILKFIRDGMSNKQISSRLCLSEHTVKTHLYNCYKKLDVRNRTQAARWAQANL